MRADRPIGTYLLLWPTLIALWLAAGGLPTLRNLVIFVLGTFLMRSAGCVINDYFDRDFDGHVKRTQARPLASGELSASQARILFAILCAAAFVLVCFTNTATILLSVAAVAVAASYPLMKRITQWPQFVLGIAFSFGIPMAFTAETGQIPAYAWWLFAANISWTIAYDTYYAMVDRDDDLRIGIKSTAILFGRNDLLFTAAFQALALALMLALGLQLGLHWPYYLGLLVSVLLFVYQHRLARLRQRDDCFKAFLHNNWVGLCWFVAVVLEFAIY